MNRKKGPKIQSISNLSLPRPELHQLDNGIPVYETRMGTQEVLRIELVFRAGRPFEHKRLTSRAVGSLLKEGTRQRDAATIAEHFDFYGSGFSSPVHMDMGVVTVYCLSRHLEQLLPVLAEILTEPVFPEAELRAFIERNQQRLMVDLSRNEVVAFRAVTETMFGHEHPYGYNSMPETYAALQQQDLEQHFRHAFTADNCQLFLSGYTSPRTMELVNKHLGRNLLRGTRLDAPPQRKDFEPEKIRIPLPGTMQSAIRIGSPLFNRMHEDYNGLFILNTVLGGYFGSRLMANIREEKGYTYHIQSSIDPLLYDGYFYISTEVGNEYCEASLEEIYRELDILCNERITSDEMEMVRSYLLGSMLNMLDGPFNVSELVRTLITEGSTLEHFDEMIDCIRHITPDELRNLAQKYLRRERMWEVVVGV